MRGEAHRSPRTGERGSARPEDTPGGSTAPEAAGERLEAVFERYGLPTAVLDVREAAAYLAVTPGTVYRLVRRGELVHTRIGRSVRFRVADLEAYLEEQTSRSWEPNGRGQRAGGTEAG